MSAQTPYWCWACWSPRRECSCSPAELREYEETYRKARDRWFPYRGMSTLLAGQSPPIRLRRVDVS